MRRMKTRLLAAAFATTFATGALVALTAAGAAADIYITDQFHCAGPYTSGWGQATTGAGTHVHRQIDQAGTLHFVASWTNSGTTSRFSNYHGSGTQQFYVFGQTGPITNVSRGCHLI
jgi:hypothetical protein